MAHELCNLATHVWACTFMYVCTHWWAGVWDMNLLPRLRLREHVPVHCQGSSGGDYLRVPGSPVVTLRLEKGVQASAGCLPGLNAQVCWPLLWRMNRTCQWPAASCGSAAAHQCTFLNPCRLLLLLQCSCQDSMPPKLIQQLGRSRQRLSAHNATFVLVVFLQLPSTPRTQLL